jgi:pyrroloquinoline quinone biosynthesis protein B
MRARFLGTAAGGGLPQWNCACTECARARRDGVTRTQDCLAVSGDGQAWYLVNASPDLRIQLLRTPELAPESASWGRFRQASSPGPAARDTPVRGVLLTSAELDHTAGLLALREADRLAVYATAPVSKTLFAAPILNAYTTVDWRTVVCGEPIELDGGLTATAFALGSKRPRYAMDTMDAPDWVVGYRFTEAAGRGALVYAPCLAAWSPSFDAAISDADVVVLDGTFYSPDEMNDRTGLARPARDMGHLPIQESLPLLRAKPGPRYLYTHLNNTNPLVHPSAPQRALLLDTGADVAPEDGFLDL